MPRQQPPRVSVVVVCARDPQRLLRCLSAVRREAGDVAIEAIVVLNAAEAGVREALERDAPWARAVRSEIPLGFAGGVNLGARHARGELLHVLHDDAEVCPGWLDELLDVLEQHPRAGAVASLLIGHDGRPQTAGQVVWRDGRSQPPWLEPPTPDELRTATVCDSCSSAAVLIRRAVWDAVGGFEVQLHPAQFVDGDFAMKLRRRGWLVMCAPRSHVRHERGGSASTRLKYFATIHNGARFAATWARELEGHEPYAQDAETLERALAGTRRRTESILALPAAPAAPPEPAAPSAETAAERVARERAALLRDNAFKAAYIAHLEQVADAAEHGIGDAHRHREVNELAIREQWARELSEQEQAARERLATELHAAQEQAAAREAELTVHVAALEHRSRMLDGILAGGWWRLRTRLLPLLRAGARVRALVRRRRRRR
jgi:GT2 family glycosyltransferase